MHEALFISYSHLDAALLQEFQHALNIGGSFAPLVWSDERLAEGDDWEKEIQKALKNANLALLLVTRNFLQSSYIQTKELPNILKRANENTLSVWSVSTLGSIIRKSNISSILPSTNLSKSFP